MKIELIITGKPMIKKNSRPNRVLYPKGSKITKLRGGTNIFMPGNQKLRAVTFKSNDLQNAEEAAIYELKSQFSGEMIRSAIHAQFTFYVPDRRKRDLSNLYEFPQDCLEEAGIIENDNQIFSHDGSRMKYDPQYPRTEISLFFF